MSQGGFRLEAINSRGLIRELVRNLWVIIVTGVAVWLGVTGIGQLTYVPEYTASTTLVVNMKGSAGAYYNSLYTNIQMADVFSQVFQSDALAKRIQEDMGESMDVSVSCSSIPETNLIVLRVSSSNPRHAYMYIHSSLANYQEISEYVYENAALEIVQAPEVPVYPSNASGWMARRSKLVMLSMIGMAGLILVFYVLRYTVKNAGAASKQLDGSIQGIIPFEKKNKGFKLRRKKNKKALLLTSSIVSLRYAEANRRMASRLERHMAKRNQQVLLVSSISENEGKSTVSANIAIALSEKHKKVLLIEGDLRKPAQYKVFGREKKRVSFKEVLEGKAKWQNAMVYNSQTRIYELLLFGPVPNPGRYMNREHIKHLLDEMRKEMDYIIIDTSPIAAASDAEGWMSIVDTVALVVREDWSDIRVINDAVDIIWKNCDDYAGFVLNAFQGEWKNRSYHYGYEKSLEAAEVE